MESLLSVDLIGWKKVKIYIEQYKRWALLHKDQLKDLEAWMKLLPCVLAGENARQIFIIIKNSNVKVKLFNECILK